MDSSTGASFGHGNCRRSRRWTERARPADGARSWSIAPRVTAPIGTRARFACAASSLHETRGRFRSLKQTVPGRRRPDSGRNAGAVRRRGRRGGDQGVRWSCSTRPPRREAPRREQHHRPADGDRLGNAPWSHGRRWVSPHMWGPAGRLPLALRPAVGAHVCGLRAAVPRTTMLARVRRLRVGLRLRCHGNSPSDPVASRGSERYLLRRLAAPRREGALPLNPST